ncbi:tetratricopeptide repeat protein [Pseudophaeobacter sp.]|jgi:tetratricopeptide (TPR) repeat protein|uniref:tetratricopeptide repeat protein n=1 Tax=Pseudophaeobacter sp. TaxID=1971739 RepID=UPI0025ED9DC8|nr:tetratricopeptide repeat protein [uncultured Pseudophaeobacter sp.]
MIFVRCIVGLFCTVAATSFAYAGPIEDCSQENNLRLSVRACSKVIELNLLPEKSEMTYYFRGNAHHRLGNTRRALKDLHRSVEINPSYKHPYIELGIISKNRKNYKLALEHYNKALEIDPRFAKAYYNRGNVYFGMNRYTRSIADYDRATELEPNYVFPYIGRAFSLLEMGDNKAALVSAEHALRLAPRNAHAAEIRAHILDEAKRN